MLEDDISLCPVCHAEIPVKVLRAGKKTTYLVANDCPKCKTTSSKIEKGLNWSGRWGQKTEKSYLQLGMKDRK